MWTELNCERATLLAMIEGSILQQMGVSGVNENVPATPILHHLF